MDTIKTAVPPNPALTGTILRDQFRVILATDLEIAQRAATFAGVTGSVGAVEIVNEMVQLDHLDRALKAERYAVVVRHDLPDDAVSHRIVVQCPHYDYCVHCHADNRYTWVRSRVTVCPACGTCENERGVLS